MLDPRTVTANLVSTRRITSGHNFTPQISHLTFREGKKKNNLQLKRIDWIERKKEKGSGGTNQLRDKERERKREREREREGERERERETKWI